ERGREAGAVPVLEARGLTVDHGDGRGVFDVDFLLRPGQTLGIVGPIGSGKSTLLRALMRLLPHGGELRLDGVDSRAFTLEALRESFAFVPQNPTLLSKSLAGNVAFGSPEATRADVEHVLDLAAMLQEARALPQGLETPIGERGVTLSGGQKQRCAIARALLRRSPVLLLDDALSAVDTATEAQILAALHARDAAQSTVVVAHRLTSVRHADLILVLDDGRVVERGTHAQLVAAGGLYAEMAARQRSSAPAAASGGPTPAKLPAETPVETQGRA
ncbi:MAG: ABC transporter ATP-binding protein, partial [Caulobacteraceae bacterium]|nr:ABC transporter ATP-binding protein [Caulobacter sp.]